jgi:hypothetical protein
MIVGTYPPDSAGKYPRCWAERQRSHHGPLHSQMESSRVAASPDAQELSPEGRAAPARAAKTAFGSLLHGLTRAFVARVPGRSWPE